MTWTPISDEEMKTTKNVITWIRTARAGYNQPDWLPSTIDILKSALFERLRSGKAPLAEPPPRGYSCPWYAVVEDPGPHYLFEVYCCTPADLYGAGFIILQSHYCPVEKLGPQEFIIRDGGHNTSYRWRLWFDAAWRHPKPFPHQKDEGAWFMELVK